MMRATSCYLMWLSFAGTKEGKVNRWSNLHLQNVGWGSLSSRGHRQFIFYLNAS